MPSLSPPISFSVSEILSLPEIFHREAISPEGFVTSIQAARYPGMAAKVKDLSALAKKLQFEYVKEIAGTSGLPVRPEESEKGSTFYLLRRPLIRMGPPEAAGEGVSRRKVLGGFLVAPEDRGKGILETRAFADGKDLIVVVSLEDYRSAIRGTAPTASLRTWLYLQTQARLHETVGKRFLRGFQPS
ncbi:MAG: hypothetical protein AB1405_05475 [Bdellovibrionota bacterium]